LPPKSVRPKPPVDGLLIRFQHVLAQAKASVKKRPVIRVRSVEILNQAQQSCAIKTRELGLNIGPLRLRFRLTFDHVAVRFYCETDSVGRTKSEQVALRHPVMPVANGLGSGFVEINGGLLGKSVPPLG